MDKSVESPVVKKSLKAMFGGRIRGYFLAGIAVTAPIAITFYLTFAFISLVDRSVAQLFPETLSEGIFGGLDIPGLGFVTALIFFVLIGFLATNFLGRFFIRLYESILDRMPVIRNIYGAVKQIFETVMATQSTAFREVIMFEYPRKGLWAIGFVTGTSEGEVQTQIKSETLNVFVPTTPNPTSGFLIFVPKKDVIYLNMSVEEGVKLVVSAGIIAPDQVPIKKK